jgi:uncharacterized membrane protein
MTLLVLGLALFLGIHSVSIFAGSWRDEQVAHRGEGPWKGLYSAVAAVGLVMIVFGYAQARQSPTVLFVPPLWMRHVALLLMAPVFALLIAAYMPGRIQAAAKHPMLLATKLWALSHLLANGNLADLLLFGAFLAWAVADRISLKRRPARPIPGAAERPLNDVVVLLGGLLLYIAFTLFLHRWLIGVSPLG